MIESEVAKTVKKRKSEQKGRVVALQLVDGRKIIGTLEDHNVSTLFVREFKEPQFVKDIDRTIVARFVVSVQGGDNGSS